MEKNNNQKLSFIFPDYITMSEVVRGILNNYGFKETIEDAYQKSSAGKKTYFKIVRDIAFGLAEKKIKETDTVVSLQSQLPSSREVAEKILLDIIKKIIPFARVLTFDDDGHIISGLDSDVKPNIDVFPKIKPPMEVEKILAEQQKKVLEEKIIESPRQTPIQNESLKNEPVKAPQKKKSRLPEKQVIEKSIQKGPKKLDSYRESIE